jgi:hypothetical protein
MSGLIDNEKLLRDKIAKDLEELETPTDISPDWYLATKRTKMAAIAIVKHGLQNG